MKKIIFVMILLIGSISSINAAEKRDCSGIKKLSKAFIACKSGNFKSGVVNAGSKVKNSLGSKKEWQSNGNTISTTKKVKKEKKVVKKKAKKIAKKVKVKSDRKTLEGMKAIVEEKVSNLFKSSKKYPKHTKK